MGIRERESLRWNSVVYILPIMVQADKKPRRSPYETTEQEQIHQLRQHWRNDLN